jgi:branched-chain amino acid transport system substrate-binding protein
MNSHRGLHFRKSGEEDMKRTKIGAPRRRLVMALGLAHILLGFAASGAIAQKNYAPGVTDTEIKLGQTMPYSGPASPYSAIGKAESAYFNMINEQGGVNGRKINLISLDDAFSPPKTVEQTRRLVEEDPLRLIGNPLARPPTRQSKDI